jgi:hypothetical protein
VSGDNEAQNAQANNSGRDEKGRFVKGQWAGGPGRPPRAREEAYLAVLRELLSLGKFAEIVKAQILKAGGGDLQAAQWLTDYAIGKPRQQIAIEREAETPNTNVAELSDEELLEIISAAEGDTERSEGRTGAPAAGKGAGGT